MKKTALQKLDDIDQQIQDLTKKREKLNATVVAEDMNALKAKFVGRWVTIGGWGTHDEHTYDKASGGHYRIFKINGLRKFAPGEYRLDGNYRLNVSDELDLRSDGILFCRTKRDPKCDIKDVSHLTVISEKKLAGELHRINRSLWAMLSDLTELEKTLNK